MNDDQFRGLVAIVASVADRVESVGFRIGGYCVFCHTYRMHGRPGHSPDCAVVAINALQAELQAEDQANEVSPTTRRGDVGE